MEEQQEEQQVEVTRLARIEDGVVVNVIAAPAGVGPEYASDVLQQPGLWVLDPFVQAGVGFLFDQETGAFTDPTPPVEEPPAEEPTE